MKLTHYTDFGLKALLYLGTLPADELSSVADIASLYQVSRHHMVKVTNQLVKLGYVRAVRGKGGGIALAMRPEDIPIGHVVRALEGDLTGIDCHHPPCAIVPACLLKAALAEAMAAFLAVLDRYTLADLLRNKTALQLIWQGYLPAAAEPRPSPATKLP